MGNLETREAKHFLNDMLEEVHKTYPMVEAFLINPKTLFFERRMRMNCFYCGRYNRNWHCPPFLPDIDYEKMFAEYDFGAFVYVKIPLSNSDARNESSVINHRSLLLMEKYCYNHNNSTAISFIGGSCKLCKNGCGKERCNNPYEARSPLEATGCNVVKSAAQYGFEITFPPKEYMLRLGLILW